MNQVKVISRILYTLVLIDLSMATSRFYTHRNGGGNGSGGGGGNLTSQETDSLLACFPNTRLSYEASIHKNELLVPGYKCFILPKGKRCVAWITEWKRRKIVAVIDIAGSASASGSGGLSPTIRKFHQENGWIPGSVRLYDACMNHMLAYGTVFAGVIFRLTEKTHFSIHTIHWYKGNPIPSLTLSGHVRLCEKIFAERDIEQVAYTKQNSIMFGLPVLCDSDEGAASLSQRLPYQVYAIQYRYNTHTKVTQRILQSGDCIGRIIAKVAPAPMPAPMPAPIATSIPYIQPMDEMLTNIQATFIIRPNVQNDIYELFVMPSSRGREPVFHNFAHIPSYKTSVMMNRLFRNIAENQRLDALEESEDETEFENTDPDKYLSPQNKEEVMICRFHKRFCRWVPIQVISGKTAAFAGVITDQHVNQHEYRYKRNHTNRK